MRTNGHQAGRALAASPWNARASSGASFAGAALRAPAAGLRSLLLVLALLAAFLGQDVVTQSHVHPLGAGWDFETAVQTGGAATGAAAEKRHPAKAPADCPICRELAMAGHYLAPGPLVLPQPLSSATWLFVLPVAILAFGSRSHSWRSRAPPF